MNDNIDENDIYDNVFYTDEQLIPPPKPPRSFTYDKEVIIKINGKGPPIKPPRGKQNSSENHIDEIDLSYLTLNVSSEQLTHLTKNRAKLPEKRVPGRHLNRQRSQSNAETNKSVKDTAIELMKSRRRKSMVEFSRIRRTAVKIKPINK